MHELLAIVATFTLLALAIFQAALAGGAPLGRYAWGGQHVVLPTNLRIGSAFSIATYLVFSILILSHVGLVTAFDLFDTTMPVRIIACYLCIGIVMNAISRSRKERLVMTPIATVLALCFVRVGFW